MSRWAKWVLVWDRMCSINYKKTCKIGISKIKTQIFVYLIKSRLLKERNFQIRALVSKLNGCQIAFTANYNLKVVNRRCIPKCSRYLTGCLGRIEDQHPSRHLLTSCQTDQNLHERGPRKATHL